MDVNLPTFPPANNRISVEDTPDKIVFRWSIQQGQVFTRKHILAFGAGCVSVFGFQLIVNSSIRQLQWKEMASTAVVFACVLAFLIAWEAILDRYRKASLEISRDGIRFVVRGLRRQSLEECLPLDGLVLVKSFQSLLSHNIMIVGTGHRTIVMNDFADASEAEWLSTQIESALGRFSQHQ